MTQFFSYYILEYSTDGINVYYTKFVDEEGQFLYHATRKCVTQGNVGTYTLVSNVPFYALLFVLAVLSVYLSIYNVETKDVM